MLYIGLVVGAFLGICISIIALVIIKEFFIREKSAELDQQANETLPARLSSFPTGGKEEWLSDVSR